MKMKIMSILVLMTVNTACGRAPASPVEPTYQKFVDLFELVAEKEGKHINVTTSIFSIDKLFIDGKEYVAICDVTTKTIFVSESYWKVADDNYKTSIIFHELGHCELGRDHRDDKLPNGAPASIMNTGAPNGGHYAANFQYYNHELFSN